MLTANAGKRHQAYAESLGVDAYLLKPAPLDKIVDVCQQLATTRRQEAQPAGKEGKGKKK
jgi:CheY-like chemotaxis protein